MRRRRFLRRHAEPDDPLAGFANLFDAAMVFALALMVALVSRYRMTEMLSAEDFTIVKNPGRQDMEIITRKGGEILRYKAGESAGEYRARGRRVGVAYQLESGEIVYVPEGVP